MRLYKRADQGFTLAELLISLAILGVIATFTIPKILNASANGKNTAIAKEAASMVAGAFSEYQLNNSVVAGTTGGDLTQYMNYVATDVTTALTSGDTCSASKACLKLHNGGILEYATADTFGGTTTTDAIEFNIDPDGAGTIGGATFVQFYNGRFTTLQQAGTIHTAGTIHQFATDPSYIQTWN